MNIVVILFMYCVLDLDYKRALYWMLGTVCIPHVVLFIAVCIWGLSLLPPAILHLLATNHSGIFFYNAGMQASSLLRQR